MGFWGDVAGFFDLTNRDAGLTKGVLGVTGAIIEPFFALGGGINAATGGTTATYNVWQAEKATGTTYSNVTQALSGYQGATPGGGSWGIPLLNPATARVAGDIINTTVKGALGVDTKTLLLIAGLVGAAVLVKD